MWLLTLLYFSRMRMLDDCVLPVMLCVPLVRCHMVVVDTSDRMEATHGQPWPHAQRTPKMTRQTVKEAVAACATKLRDTAFAAPDQVFGLKACLLVVALAAQAGAVVNQAQAQSSASPVNAKSQAPIDSIPSLLPSRQELHGAAIAVRTSASDIIASNVPWGGFVLYGSTTVGWSDTTLYRHAETTNQKAIVAAAVNGGNRASPQSIIGTPWVTDTSNGDGARMRAAIQDVYNNWIANGRPYLPLGSIPTAVQNTMRSRLSATYKTTSDQNGLIERIRLRFNGTVPTEDGTLAYLVILAQCKEFADRMVQAGGGIKRSYGSAAVARTDIRPGMYAFKNNNGHAAIVVAVYWDASGQPTQLRLAESNYASVWSNPVGQIPWNRTIAIGRAVPISDYYVVKTE